MEDLLLHLVRAGKEEMLGQFLVALYEQCPEFLLVADFQALGGIAVAAAFDVDRPANSVDAEVAALIVLEELFAIGKVKVLKTTSIVREIKLEICTYLLNAIAIVLLPEVHVGSEHLFDLFKLKLAGTTEPKKVGVSEPRIGGYRVDLDPLLEVFEHLGLVL